MKCACGQEFEVMPPLDGHTALVEWQLMCPDCSNDEAELVRLAIEREEPAPEGEN